MRSQVRCTRKSVQPGSPSSSSLLGCTEKELYTLAQTNEQLKIEVELLKEKLAIAEEIVEIAKEVVENMIPSKSNMIRGNGLVKFKEQLNSN